MEPRWRVVAPGMRAVFVVGSVLVAGAGVQLFILTDHTDRFFAWTISPGSSAAFLGAFYLTALTLASQGAVQREWARARVGVLGVWLFVTVTLVTTLLHLDKFHFGSDDVIAQGAAWLWTVIYAVEPFAILWALLLQLRVPGEDRPRERRLPSWYRAGLIVQAAVLFGVGAVLFVAPSTAGWWPWTVTPLVARAMASWVLGLAVVLASAAWEDDWDRIRIATSSYVVLGVMGAVGAIRYRADLRGGTSTVLYLTFLGVAVVTGAYGMIRARTR